MPSLTNLQREILSAMASGGTLIKNSGWSFQSIYAGRRKLTRGTLDALIARKFIKQTKTEKAGIALYLVHYELTDRGREVVS